MQLSRLRTSRTLIAGGLAAAAIATAGVGIAVAATSSAAPSNATSVGHGIGEFGMTKAFFTGQAVSFTYSSGFRCDTSVHSYASSGCEAGANYVKPAAKNFDPLYITVPLGFAAPMVDCPATLVCVDHPGTMDLTRLEKALKPLYPKLTNAQLFQALKNFPVPAHDHFITDTNNNKAEYWDVKIIGVTNAQTFADIRAHRSFAYIRQLQKAHNKNVTATISTNLFLFFSVH